MLNKKKTQKISPSAYNLTSISQIMFSFLLLTKRRNCLTQLRETYKKLYKIQKNRIECDQNLAKNPTPQSTVPKIYHKKKFRTQISQSINVWEKLSFLRAAKGKSFHVFETKILDQLKNLNHPTNSDIPQNCGCVK